MIANHWSKSIVSFYKFSFDIHVFTKKIVFHSFSMGFEELISGENFDFLMLKTRFLKLINSCHFNLPKAWAKLNTKKLFKFSFSKVRLPQRISVKRSEIKTIIFDKFCTWPNSCQKVRLSKLVSWRWHSISWWTSQMARVLPFRV